MIGNPYRDENGHYTSKANDGGRCLHLGKNKAVEQQNKQSNTNTPKPQKPRSQQAISLAKTKMEKTRAIEPKVSKDIKNIIESNNGKTWGFDRRLKGEDSLARKIDSVVDEEGISYENAVNGMHDTLRYTSELQPENFVQNVYHTIEDIKNAGYKVMKVKNHFVGKGSDVYSDINCNFEAPDGTIFELQFNTPKALELKETAHKLYEEIREMDKNDPRIPALKKKQVELWSVVPKPKDVEFIEDIDNY